MSLQTLESGVKITQSHKVSCLTCSSCVKQLAALRELYLLQYSHVLTNKYNSLPECKKKSVWYHMKHSIYASVRHTTDN